MLPFVGRRRELEVLGGALDGVRESGVGAFVWMRGRRRVGKSRLVEEFAHAAGVPYVFYRAPRRETREALRRFEQAVSESSLPAADLVAGGVAVDSWVAALRIAADGASADRPLMIVIDELPYLVERDPGFDADLQEAWDRHLAGRPVLLIAIGSDLSMMESLIESGGALHGRPTREMVVPPFSPHETAELLDMEPADALDAYLIVGGLPTVAAPWRPGWSRKRFLKEALGDSATHFVVNGERILDGELRRTPNGRAVLEAIGSGERTFAGIRERSEVTNDATLSAALKLLVDDKRIVAQAVPYAAPPGRKSKRYSVADPYLRFWLRFVGPSIDEIDRGRADLVMTRVEKGWPSYRGMAIEPVVRQAVERMLPDERFGDARYVGSYWTRTNDVEVDLVGADSPKPERVACIGSIKWRERAPFDRRDTDELARLRAAVPGADDALLVGVSRSGFASEDAGLDVALGPEHILAAFR